MIPNNIAIGQFSIQTAIIKEQIEEAPAKTGAFAVSRHFSARKSFRCKFLPVTPMNGNIYREMLSPTS